jgi:acyl carrier protein
MEMTMNETFLQRREQVLDAVRATAEFLPDGNGLEQRLRGAETDWSFEALGFDSLARMEFCIHMECEHGIALNGGHLQAHPTVDALAAYLAGAAAG